MGKGWNRKRTFEAGQSAAWFVWLLVALVVVVLVLTVLGVQLPGA